MVIDEEDKGDRTTAPHAHHVVPPPVDEMDTEDVEPVDSSPWANSDRDYTYEEVYTSTVQSQGFIWEMGGKRGSTLA